LHGLVTTRDLLVRILRHPDFLAGRADTGFLDPARADDLFAPLLGPRETERCALAAALAAAHRRHAGARVLASLPAGWRNNPSQPATVSYHGPAGQIEVAYRPLPDQIRLLAADADRVALEIGGVRRDYAVHPVGGTSYVDSPDGGSVALTELDPLPTPVAALPEGSLLAPMPGTVLRLAAAAGDRVDAGAPLLVLEAMKMEHVVAAPAAGTVVELPVTVGSQVDAGTVLAVVKPDPNTERSG
jgi:propionyl-CoA carboxylase alpha chain